MGWTCLQQLNDILSFIVLHLYKHKHEMYFYSPIIGI